MDTVGGAAAPAFAAGPADGAAEVRDVLVRAAQRVLRVTAFHEASLDLVVRESGVEPSVARRLFPTWGDLVLATLQMWDAERTGPLLAVAEDSGAVAFLRAIVQANLRDPALMRLVAAMAPIAATPGHPMAPHLQAAWISFHATVQRALIQDIAVGREPDTIEPARGAEQVIAVYEGLQFQLMARPHFDVLEAFDRAVMRLRDGWALDYHQPTWQI